MSKKPRRAIPPRIEADLRSFYGGRRCVVSGRIEDSDWHHLDDDPSNSVFENLIPLPRDRNGLLEIYRRIHKTKCQRYLWFDPLLSPDSLTLYSASHFERGEASLAYGCGRLASRLVIQYPRLFPQSDVAVLFQRSMSLARHAGNQALMVDVLQRDITTYLNKHGLSASLRNTLLFELAALFQDYQHLQPAEELFCGLSAASEEALLVKTARRQLLSKIATGCNLEDAERVLRDIRSDTHSLDLSVATDNAEAWRLLAAGEASRAFTFLAPVMAEVFTDFGVKRTSISPWNALESAITFLGSRLLIERQPSLRDGAVSGFQRIVRAMPSGVILRPIALRLSTMFQGSVGSELVVMCKEAGVRADVQMSSQLRAAATNVARKLLAGKRSS